MERGVPAYSPGFRSLDEERDDLELAVEGGIPAWLSGPLVRNGPGRFEVGGERVEHRFDGLAMLHKFPVRGGCGDILEPVPPDRHLPAGG